VQAVNIATGFSRSVSSGAGGAFLIQFLPVGHYNVEVHGSMRAYNGNPTFRIWRIGTNRPLGVTGVHPGEEPILPEGLACGFGDVFADFEVCPFTKERPGVVRRVCIEAAKNVIRK
jgi:hypothetical protein